MNFCSASCSLLITCIRHSLIKFRQLEQFKHNRFRKSESFALYVIFFRSALHRSLSSLASQLCRALFRTFPNSFDSAHFFRSKFDGSYVRGILQLREKKTKMNRSVSDEIQWGMRTLKEVEITRMQLVESLGHSV